MASCANEELASELELVTAMCSEDELQVEEVGEGVNLSVKMAPMTAGDEANEFLWCVLELHVACSYPSQPPSLTLGSSRGLSDVARASLLTELVQRAEVLRGEPALFALLEAGRVALTALNTPEGDCAICLASLSDVESEQVLRMPCYHVFHRRCVIEYCRSELSRDRQSGKHADAADLSVLCPECRAEMPWTGYPELQAVLAQAATQRPGSAPCDELSSDKSDRQEEIHAGAKAQSVEEAAGDASSRHEAFIRLHHLHRGNDEKEKPLLRLLRELGLDAVVYYGKPALLHIQGDPKDVDAFAGTAKRRHITVTIDVAQRSEGPAIANGVTSVAARKGSLDSGTLKEHLDKRGRGETTFTIIGS